MRRIAVIVLLVLPVVALVIGWLIWMRAFGVAIIARAQLEIHLTGYSHS
jgi:hypothetical protein